ncbi:MAG: serine/threonine protein kinase [Gammaproteobacteria bacterium]|nr:MAG: serine/threonine protein kinase [Gammaproteobacteria bacterium]
MEDAISPEAAVAAHPFTRLDPTTLIEAVEARGLRCDGRLLALNSYENRVWQVGLEDDAPVIVKFYRPGRWSDAAIEEEHAYTMELAAAGLPVVPPLAGPDGRTLYHHGPWRLAIYPRHGGRAPELDNPTHLRQLGRTLARIHNIGATTPFRHRPLIDLERLGTRSRDYLLEHDWLPPELRGAYESLTADLLIAIGAAFARAGDYTRLRLHGDCHPGNILWRDEAPSLVDFDDARTGPAIQDLWMFLSGDREYMSRRLGELIEGYTLFRDFDPRELNLVEALRTLRMMHHAAWLARRWDDPAFPRAFSDITSPRYWDEHILMLREQAAMLQEPPLVLE